MPPIAPTIDHLIEPVGQCLTAEVAERLVLLRAKPELQLEVDRLADKANLGTLTEDERAQYEQYVSFSQFVTLLQIEARDLLDSRSGADLMDETLRQFVRERAGHRCEYCRLPQDAAPFLRFHVEHIQAAQHVLDDSESNLCLACPRCNLQKGPNLATLSIPDRKLIRLFHPREDVWEGHFESVDGFIVGKTEIGTATARLLLMNASGQVRIRRKLTSRGEY